MFKVMRDDETFEVDAAGNIGRPAIGMKPSEDWKLIAVIRRNNFGKVVESVSFQKLSYWLAQGDIQWRHKNGKPRYTCADRDHGTYREWGNPVLKIYEVEG